MFDRYQEISKKVLSPPSSFIKLAINYLSVSSKDPNLEYK